MHWKKVLFFLVRYKTPQTPSYGPLSPKTFAYELSRIWSVVELTDKSRFEKNKFKYILAFTVDNKKYFKYNILFFHKGYSVSEFVIFLCVTKVLFIIIN